MFNFQKILFGDVIEAVPVIIAKGFAKVMKEGQGVTDAHGHLHAASGAVGGGRFMSKEQIMAIVRNEAFNRGVKIEHGRVTGEGAGSSASHTQAVTDAIQRGVSADHVNAASNEAVTKGRLAFKDFHRENPHAADGMSRKEIVEAVRDHSGIDTPTAHTSAPIPAPVVAPVVAPVTTPVTATPVVAPSVAPTPPAVTPATQGTGHGQVPITPPASTAPTVAAPVPTPAAPIPATPQLTHAQLLANVKDAAYAHGAKTAHSLLTHVPAPHSTALADAVAAAQVGGVDGHQISSTRETATHQGTADFQTLANHTPVAARALPHDAVAAVAQGFAAAHAAQQAAAQAPITPAASPTAPMPQPVATHSQQSIVANRFINTSDGHNKYWKVATHGNHLVVHYGVIGTNGQTKVKEYPSVAAAKAAQLGLITQKLGKGYISAGQSNIHGNLPILPAGATPTEPAHAAPVPTPAPHAAPSTPAVQPAVQAPVTPPASLAQSAAVTASGVNYLTHPQKIPLGGSAEDHLHAFIASHVQRVMDQHLAGADVDPNKIQASNSALRRSRIAQALVSEGKTGFAQGSEITQARAQAKKVLQKHKDETAAQANAPAEGTSGKTVLQQAEHALRVASHQRGRNIEQYTHDSIAHPEYAQLRDKIDNLHNQVKALSSKDNASTISQTAIDAGKAERLSELVVEKSATKALQDSAHAEGFANGYKGGVEGKTASDEDLEAHAAKVATHHSALASIIGDDKATKIRNDAYAKGKNHGETQHKNEINTHIENLSNSIISTAVQQGRLQAVGQTLPPSTLAGLATTMHALDSFAGEGNAKVVHAAGLKSGVKQVHQELTDNLATAARNIGYHAGKNTEPTSAERLASETAHSLAKQHLGLEKANAISSKAHEEGKQEALNPDMTADKVKSHMDSLGIGNVATPQFCEQWKKHMPKISPTEFFKAFFGDDATPSNLKKLSLSFSGGGFSMSGSHVMLHGSKATDIRRSFDFNSKVVEHGYLKIAPEDQSKGAVRKMFKALLVKGSDGKCAYQRMGMDACHVHGALDGGGYTWPKFGFYYDTPQQADYHHKQISRNLGIAINKLMDSSEGTTANFDTFKAKVGEVKLPNADGTFSKRAITPDDHAKYTTELKGMRGILESSNQNTSWLLTNMNTPMMNAIHGKFVANAVGEDKRPTLVKALMRGTDMYGTIKFNNDVQMAHIHDYVTSN